MNSFERLLELCASTGATDLHISAGAAPRLRLSGELRPVEDVAPLSPDCLDAMARGLMDGHQRQVFEARRSLDVARTGPDGSRFRIHLYAERRSVAFAIRRLEEDFRPLAEWNLPVRLGELARLRDGLVLVTGPTGSGKTTTLATLLDMINRERSCHIVTIEDPIEYLHEHVCAFFHQRELHTHVPSFADAVRAAMREDPDVILVGEMRDLETMRAALTAAETGHLVFSTLHTGDAVGAIERMVGVFPADEQMSVRRQLSLVLREVVTQRLVPRRAGGGLVPAVEILRITNAVANLIRAARSEQIHSVMEGGSALGMRTLEQDLASLVSRGIVDLPQARQVAHHPDAVEQWLATVGIGRD